MCVLFVGDGFKYRPRLLIRKYVRLENNAEKAEEVNSMKSYSK
jgi:hypothetical protein